MHNGYTRSMKRAFEAIMAPGWRRQCRWEGGAQFCEHYHGERNHQRLDNEIVEPEFGSDGAGEVRCRERLAGLLRYYYRDAA